MKRPPVFATILVLVAVTAMIGLGFWQLQRKREKEAALSQYVKNAALPAIAFPSIPVGDALLYRRTSALCLTPTSWRIEGAGSRGWRHIAQCRTGAEGPGFAIDMGTSPDVNYKPSWRGGMVRGTIAQAPSHQSLIAGLIERPVRTLMIVSDTALPGLKPTARPSPESIPNNHLAYAVQWFLFAGIALAIYAIALRRRMRGG